MKLSTIKPNPSNPRTIKSGDLTKLGKSIRDFEKMMTIRKIIIDENNIILGGNQRYAALKELGYKNIPDEWVEKVTDLTEAEKKEFIIKDNSPVGGEWDFELLASGWDTAELEDWGLDFPDDWGGEDIEAKEDDYEIPETIETDIVLGDLFEIGDHRLLCGDSTDSEQILRLMGREKADMVFTDPPYGMNLDTDYSSMKGEGMKGTIYNKVIGDNNDFTPELINIIFACFNDCKEIFIFGADYFAELLPNKNEGSWIVWDKRESEMTGKNVDARFGSMFELCWSKVKHKRLIARIMWAGMMGVKDDSKRIHPTQKPTHLAKWFFEQWGKENDLIADLYLGSGSTMVAAEMLKRRCFGIEISPEYCQVILDRMLKLDPSLIIKKNGIQQ